MEEGGWWLGVVCGVCGFRSGVLSVVLGWARGACLESAAGRNRMSRRVSVEPAPLISGSRCSLLGCRAMAFRLTPSGCQLSRENTSCDGQGNCFRIAECRGQLLARLCCLLHRCCLNILRMSPF